MTVEWAPTHDAVPIRANDSDAGIDAETAAAAARQLTWLCLIRFAIAAPSKPEAATINIPFPARFDIPQYGSDYPLTGTKLMGNIWDRKCKSRVIRVPDWIWRRGLVSDRSDSRPNAAFVAVGVKGRGILWEYIRFGSQYSRRWWRSCRLFSMCPWLQRRNPLHRLAMAGRAPLQSRRSRSPIRPADHSW